MSDASKVQKITNSTPDASDSLPIRHRQASPVNKMQVPGRTGFRGTDSTAVCNSLPLTPWRPQTDAPLDVNVTDEPDEAMSEASDRTVRDAGGAASSSGPATGVKHSVTTGSLPADGVQHSATIGSIPVSGWQGTLVRPKLPTPRRSGPNQLPTLQLIRPRQMTTP
jgi:hypothetical protein